MDPKAQSAREHHRAALEHGRIARQHRQQRDDLVRSLYGAGGWSYATLARAVGCTPDLIAKIVKPQQR